MIRFRLFLTIVLMSVVLVACGGGNKPATTDNMPAATAMADATAVPEENTTSSDNGTTQQNNNASTDQNAATSTGDEWSGSNFNSHLDELASYSAHFVFESGSGDAKQVWSWQQNYTSEPRAIELFSNDKSTDTQAGAYHLVQIADKMYSVSKDPAQCIVVTNKPDSSGLQPDSIISGLPFSMKKEGPGPDMFGQATDKYSYTADDLNGSSYQATAIVDRAKGFAYSYDVTGTQKNGDAKEPFHWTYELKDVNALPAIVMPKECATVASGSTWPMPDGAQMSMQTNEMTSFTSDKSVKDVADFYAKEMPKAGYAVGDGGMTTDTSVMAVYTKDGKTVNVMINGQDGKTTIIITQQ